MRETGVFFFNNMKIMILSYAAGLTEILSGKLKDFGLIAERVDYNKPIMTQITDADVLVNGLGKLNKPIIDACPKLNLIHQVGTGVDNVDIGYCTLKSIYVANVPHVNNVSVAEHTLFLMIYLAKNMKSAGEGIMKRRVFNVLGSELYGKSLTIIGLGATGVEVAKRAKAFGMYILLQSQNILIQKKGRTDKNNNNNNRCNYFINIIQGVESPSDSLIDADYILLHTPLTDETRGLIGAKEINSMKSSAFLINVARAQIVDREELFTSLVNKKIAGAAFDVFWEEPADPNDKLLKLDNFVLTPHLAGWTSESADNATRIIASNINRVLHGEKPTTVVNKTD
jgi:D-3-phosphoglycerate dehydrogenase / 2-oxoglutarate reductase